MAPLPVGGPAPAGGKAVPHVQPGAYPTRAVPEAPVDDSGLQRKSFGTPWSCTNKGASSRKDVEVLRSECHPCQEDLGKVLQRALATEQADAEQLLAKVRARFDRMDLPLPSVEIRFKDVTVEASLHASTISDLPTILNAYCNAVQAAIRQILPCLRPQRQKLAILRNLSGVLRPGRSTLLLGPPASGKSTLLKMLAGKLDAAGLEVSGMVTYNGCTFQDFLPQQTAVYVEQDDQHMAELTVRETCDFAARCQDAGGKPGALAELLKREAKLGVEADWHVDAFMRADACADTQHSLRTELLMRMLGLEICVDTTVGSQMRRGISGGQRKRVTTAEMIVGPKKVYLLDEISTGLDSSTTYQIVKFLRDQTHFLQHTTLISLLQPAPETFDLFDDVMLLSDGYLVYHGPCEHVLEFFESMGFRCPERKGTADFLQEVTSRTEQRKYWAGPGPYPGFVSVGEFAEAFTHSHVGVANQKSLSTPEQTCQPTGQQHSGEELLTRRRYPLSSWQLWRVCLARELLLLKRNQFIYGFRCLVTCIMAFITATLFSRTRLHAEGVDQGNVYFGALFFSMTNLLFDGFADETLTVQRLPGWYKQRGNLFYPAWAYVFPVTLLRIPYSLTISLIWSCIVYYPVGFAPEAGRFFTYVLLLFLMHSFGIAMFRFLASFFRDPKVTSTGASFFFLVLMMTSGFLLAQSDMPDWWIWAYWANPIAYGQQAIAINEFSAPRWQAQLTPSGETVGIAILGQRGVHAEQWWIWLGAGALLFGWAFFNCACWACHAYLNPYGSLTASRRYHRGQEAEVASWTTKDGKADSAELLDKSSMQKSHGDSATSLGDAKVELVSSCPDSQNLPCALGTLSDIEAAGCSAGDRGVGLPFKPLTLSFQGLNYYVDLPKAVSTDPEKLGPRTAAVKGKQMLQLLCGCSGVFRPGTLTALVGSSGAGKTTLMDVLAGRKTTGVITGDVRVSGHPKVQRTFARVIGYVEQTDIHSPHITVHESLMFSARLRLAKHLQRDVIDAFADEVMDLVELRPLRRSIVGLPGRSGLSLEQRKRLTIAVELVANPSIIFLDEPTSGLDARAAAVVMRAVSSTVRTGRTVVCTIHQPSIDIFEALDELLLMKNGGHIIYHGALGERSACLVEYFQAIPGVPPLAEGCNPATWMLQISTPGMEASIGVDFAQLYTRSALYEHNKRLVEQLSVPPKGEEPLAFDSDYPQGYYTQFGMIFWKFWMSYWRNPTYNATRFFFATMLGLLVGSTLWNVGGAYSGDVQSRTVQNISNILGALYLAMLFLGIINSRTVQPVASHERFVMYRERAALMYNELPFALAQCLIEVPYNLVQTLCFSVAAYFLMGFALGAAKFFWFALIIFLVLNLMAAYGIMGVFITPELVLASVLSSFFYGFWNVFAGFIIPRTSMPPWWSWYYYINPVSWGLYGIIVTQLGDEETLVTFPGESQAPMTVKQFLSHALGYELSFIGPVVGILIGFAVFFAGLAVVSIRFINYQRR